MIDLFGGYKDKEHSEPWEADTLVNVYSTTKGMTAICAHQLVEQGLLDLSAPVAHYWPEFAAEGKENLPVQVSFFAPASALGLRILNHFPDSIIQVCT